VRVLVASTYVPFLRGGGTMIVDSLAEALQRHGHQVDTVRIPLRSYWPEVAEQTLAVRCLDVTEAAGNRVDRLITIRYPAYALPHPNKVCWFIHHHRGAYDLWGTAFQDIHNSAEGLRAREMMIRSDTLYLKECQKIYVVSKVLIQRLRQFNQIEADGVLYAPLPNPGIFGPGPSEGYFLYASRITGIKRQALAIEAMKYVRSNFRLVILGQGDTDEQMASARAQAERLGVADRIEFTGWVSEAEKAQLTRGAIACFYLAYDEDSYGYSTLEAFHSHKPVITCTDSGGTHDVIEDGVNGLIVEPKAQAIAEAMERLVADPTWAAELGEAAFETIERYGITWDRVVDGLTG
jgi:glycosyltransferase involved in cell wall biosynthesis